VAGPRADVGRRPPRGLPWARAWAAALCLCAAAAPAIAQTNERIYEDLDFRFVTPGARAVAMGKTFIGLADDATAAVSNPAGLSNLLEQEFSFEFTGTKIKHQRFFPTEAGELQTFGEVVLTPSFFSYVVPLRRATLSVFRNSLQNYRERYEIGDRFIPAINGTEDGTFGNIAASVESFGFGGAYVLSRYISVGGSATLNSLDLASEARSGTPLNPRNGTNTIDSDLEWSGLAGVLVKPTPSLALGFTYNKGSIFEVKTRLFGNFLFTLPGDPPRRIDVNFTGDERDTNYVLPDRYSAGMSWRPSNSLTVLGDVSRVNYSQQITDKFLIVDFQDPAAGLSPDNFFINDVYEVHAGMEWRHYGARTTFALRGGAFTDPDHRLRFRSSGNNPDHPADYLLNFRFNTGRSKTDVGVTAGGGVTLRNRVQIDAATSFSPDATDVVVSMVVRLP
jgi:long-subunit fatty acid transport protein